MVKKQLFYLFYIFLQFYLISLRGEEAKEPEPGGAGHTDYFCSFNGIQELSVDR